jgi:ribosomal-protein-alanine N-acetyltransferase
MGGEGKRAGEILVREFREDKDAAQVAEILRGAKEATLWTEADLGKIRVLSGVSAYVSLESGRASGVAIGRRVEDEAEILNLAVKQADRRKGIGAKLVRRLLVEYRRVGVNRVFLEVRESNAGAIEFYGQLGFRLVGKRKDYYREPEESALVMELRLAKFTSPGE